MAWLIVMGLSPVVASPAWAGRPLTTEDTGTLDPGKAELELSVDYLRDGGAQSLVVPGGPVLNLGLTAGLEGTVATSFLLFEPQGKPLRAGLGDSLIRLKYRFLDETARRPALMAAVSARLPTGDEGRGLGEPGVDIQTLAVVSKTAGRVTLTLNTGYTFVIRNRDLDVANVNASVEGAITRAWALVGEVVSELATSRRTEDRAVLRMGMVHAVTERLRLDTAVGFGTTRASPDVLFTIGVTINLN